MASLPPCSPQWTVPKGKASWGGRKQVDEDGGGGGKVAAPATDPAHLPGESRFEGQGNDVC
jgi:hypothetical protein